MSNLNHFCENVIGLFKHLNCKLKSSNILFVIKHKFEMLVQHGLDLIVHDHTIKKAHVNKI
jgi:hypothetical protein